MVLNILLKNYASIVLVLAIASVMIILNDRKRSVKSTWSTEYFVILCIASITLSFLATLIFNTYIWKFIKVTDVLDMVSEMGFVSSLETMFKNIFLIIPLLFLIHKSNIRERMGIGCIKSPIKSTMLIFIIFLVAMESIEYAYKDLVLEHVKIESFMYAPIMFDNYVLTIITCVVISICSEMYFRGFIYSSIRERSSLTTAVIMSSIVSVSFVNINPYLYLIVLIDSIFYAILFEKTHTIYPSVVLHFLSLIIPLSMFGSEWPG